MTKSNLILAALILFMISCSDDSSSPTDKTPDTPTTPEKIQMMPLAVGNKWSYVRHMDDMTGKWTDIYNLELTSQLKRTFQGEDVDAYFAAIHVENYKGDQDIYIDRVYFAYGDYIYVTAELNKKDLIYVDVQEEMTRYAHEGDQLVLDGIQYDMSRDTVMFQGKPYVADFYAFEDSDEYLRKTCLEGIGLYYYDFQSYYRFDLTLTSVTLK